MDDVAVIRGHGFMPLKSLGFPVVVRSLRSMVDVVIRGHEFMPLKSLGFPVVVRSLRSMVDVGLVDKSRKVYIFGRVR